MLRSVLAVDCVQGLVLILLCVLLIFLYTRLRDVPVQVFEEYKHLLTENFRKRAAHYFGEIRRAEQGAEAWKNGDLDTYGKLIFES